MDPVVNIVGVQVGAPCLLQSPPTYYFVRNIQIKFTYYEHTDQEPSRGVELVHLRCRMRQQVLYSNKTLLPREKYLQTPYLCQKYQDQQTVLIKSMVDTYKVLLFINCQFFLIGKAVLVAYQTSLISHITVRFITVQKNCFE